MLDSINLYSSVYLYFIAQFVDEYYRYTYVLKICLG